jgi:hypothetical protein
MPVSDAAFVLLIVAVIALSLGWTYSRRQARLKAWRELAERMGLTWEPGSLLGHPPYVKGKYRGHELTLDTFRRGSGRNSTTYTRIILFVNNQSNLYLTLYEESVFSKIGKLFGAQDIQVGDEEIDRRFMIKGQPEDSVTRLLTPISLRQKLLEARSVNLEVDGRELHFEKKGEESDVNYLQFLFDLLSDLAEAVERITG